MAGRQGQGQGHGHGHGQGQEHIGAINRITVTGIHKQTTQIQDQGAEDQRATGTKVMGDTHKEDQRDPETERHRKTATRGPGTRDTRQKRERTTEATRTQSADSRRKQNRQT